VFWWLLGGYSAVAGCYECWVSWWLFGGYYVVAGCSGVLLGGCYAVGGCSEWLLGGYYAVAWVFWVIAMVLLCVLVVARWLLCS